jgi:hypothetical protein
MSRGEDYDDYDRPYPIIRFTDTVSDSEATCMPNGAGCVIPPFGAEFYPYYSLVSGDPDGAGRLARYCSVASTAGASTISAATGNMVRPIFPGSLARIPAGRSPIRACPARVIMRVSEGALSSETGDLI